VTAQHYRAVPVNPYAAPVDERRGRHRVPDAAGSVAGAASVAYRAGSQKALLLAEFAWAGDRGLTDDEAAINVGLDRSCFWKRCGELRQDGMIADTGATREGPMFKEQRMVSVITDAGYAQVAAK
jgi:hypothetical protein